ncbi:MAG: glycosyltransferase family 2 protein [Acidimicrobiales bacterium]
MRTSIAVYVCTHERNDELRRLLTSLAAAAEQARDRASVALVIVDDNPDGRAKLVADEVAETFELGVTYRHSGARNISIARNMGLDSAAPLADWVGMVDDDVILRPDWFTEHLDLQERTGAGATTGPLLLTFPEGPSWLTDEPFAEIGLHDAPEDAKVLECQTGNSMVRSSFLVQNPGIRFEEDLGVVGGEDMVFYHAAIEAGLEAHYSRRVAVEEPEPAARSTLRYQLSRARWMGNTEFVTDSRNGRASRGVLAVRGVKRLPKGLLRPLQRLTRGQPPQIRYAMAIMSEGVGVLLGVLGLRLAHR